MSSNSGIYSRKIFKTIVGNNSKISHKAIIAESNVIVGNNVTIEDNVIIKENVAIKDSCVIRSGSIIGGEGFQFNKGKKIFLVKHCGGVIIGKDVEIQYNTCIDKALFPWNNAIIGNQTKLDNLIHIGHAAKIGDNSLCSKCMHRGGVLLLVITAG